MARMSTAGLSNNIDELHAQITSMADEIRLLKEQLFLATRREFGALSEVLSVDQLHLFQSPDIQTVEVARTSAANEDTLPKKRSTRQAVTMSADTDVERVEVDLDESEKVCDCCQGRLHRIGEDCTRQIDYIPHQVRVIETVRPKYGCRQCEVGIKQKSLPASPIPKSMATPSLLAFLIVSKYLDHQPLNRIQQMLDRVGITLPRSTQCDWVMASAGLLMRLVILMKQDLLNSVQVFTDDTILPLQNDIKERNRFIQARLWVYATQSKTGPPIILYDFTRTRSKDGPQTFLKGYKGYVQADAYAGYDGLYLTGAKEVACMAHCRRKFFTAAELEKEPGPAHEALSLIGQLYRIEKQIKHYTHKKRKKVRRRYSKPLLKTLRRWMEHQITSHLPKGKFAEALQYALNHWDALSRYCEAGYLEIDNNYGEREMKPIALGRKNYLSTGSERGGEMAAVLYSFVETAKANGLNVFDYLTDVLRRLPDASEEELKALLPYSWQPGELT